MSNRPKLSFHIQMLAKLRQRYMELEKGSPAAAHVATKIEEKEQLIASMRWGDETLNNLRVFTDESDR